jgi:hypothetical protein
MTTVHALKVNVITQISIIPTSLSISLKSLDAREDIDGLVVNVTGVSESSIILQLPSLPPRRVWSATAFVCCCSARMVIDSIEIGETIIK